MLSRVCRFCKKSFTTNWHNHFLCSEDCRIKHIKAYRKKYFSGPEFRKYRILYAKEHKKRKEQERLEKYGDEVIVPLGGHKGGPHFG